jgi:hypothetical protein
MDGLQKQQWQNLVEALEDIINDRIGLTEGCRRIVGIGHSLELKNPHFNPFRGFDSESGVFPIGDVRKLWSTKALEEMDRQLEKTEAHYRAWVFEAAQGLLTYAKEQCA